jgi:hypothetical protein
MTRRKLKILEFQNKKTKNTFKKIEDSGISK